MAVPLLLRKLLMAVFLLLACTLVPVQAVHAQFVEPRPVLGDVKQISAGDNFTCVLTTAGGVKCWGDNHSGQLGDGGNGVRTYPMDVLGLSSGVKAISAGEFHACALTNAGEVRCWGAGVPDHPPFPFAQRTPVAINGLSSGVKAVDAGAGSTCVLMETGGVRCWGEVTTEKYRPVDVPELGDVVEIAVGNNDACALTTAGGVKCWGSGEEYEPVLYSEVPVDIEGLTSGVLAIDVAGESFCAVTADKVYCWGDNRYGHPPTGGGDDWQPTPVEIIGLPPNVKAIAVGIQNRCVITQEDEVLCWGNNEDGGLGNNTVDPYLSCDVSCPPSAVHPPRLYPPTKVVGLNGPQQAIASHNLHTCALSSERTVRCWGWNGSGDLGIGPTVSVPHPTAVQDLEEQILSLELGGWYTCAQLAGGSYRCWGNNTHGQLGTGDTVTHWSPRPLTVITDSITSLATSYFHSCAVTAEGAVQCWGDNYFGQLGNGTFEESLVAPVGATGLDNGVKQVVAGARHSCALLENGSVQCWGAIGRVGNGMDQPVPVPIPGLESGVVSISAGIYHTCALMTDSRVKCWGDRYAMLEVAGFRAPIAKLDAGGFFNCALLINGGVQCWGSNVSGELGIDNRDVPESPVPVDVRWLQSGVKDIAAGGMHACAVTMAGAYCWGNNANGRIGDGLLPTDSWESRDRPVKVVGLGSNVAAIFAGGTQTCAILKDRSVKCWGNNNFGQLGFNPGWSAMDVHDARLLHLPYAGR